MLNKMDKALPFDIADPELFGNEAAEDEDPEVLASYFVDKPSFGRFTDSRSRFAIVRARKGLGKSALMSKVAHDILMSKGPTIVVHVKGADLTSLGEFSSSDPAVLTNQWQQVICATINLEIGKRLKFAWTDNHITMVEASELSGFRNRNIVGALMERLKIKFKAPIVEVDITKPVNRNPLFILKNYEDDLNGVDVWLFVDDIDATFLNVPAMQLKIATFFSACRKLVTDVNGLTIRASVRTDVWTEIRRIDESLDKCEQYALDIFWSQAEAKDILIKKIFSYITRTIPNSRIAQEWSPDREGKEIFQLVFPNKVPWGDGGSLWTDAAIHIFSSGRPRWSGQLCRLAAAESVRRGSGKIIPAAIWQVMPRFGQFRLDDIYREHSHQFSELQGLIESFAGGRPRYTTEELRRSISGMYLSSIDEPAQIPILYGRPLRDELELCQFLYKVGFVIGRDKDLYRQGEREYVRYEDRPDLLTNINNLDDGLMWEIPASYRSALRIQ